MKPQSVRLDIGSQIRRLRLEQRRTQQEIAEQCGFTKSLLSKIEANRVMPPVATLVKIAQALGTNVGTLIEAGQNGASVASTAEESLKNLTRSAQGYWIHPFATRHQGKRMQPFLFVVRKGQVCEHHLTHEGEEFIYVLKGRIKVEVGDETHRLGPGDALYFDAAYPHQVQPLTSEAHYLDIFA